MRVMVSGGRNFQNQIIVEAVLDRLEQYFQAQFLIISGAARGADTLAELWALNRKRERQLFPADWAKHGLAAGPKRNTQMIKEGKPDLVVVFPGGRGTADALQKAGEFKVKKIVVVEVDGMKWRTKLYEQQTEESPDAGSEG